MTTPTLAPHITPHEPAEDNNFGWCQPFYKSVLSHAWMIPALLLLSLLVFYLCMFLRYRPHDIDNPWFLSFSHETFVEHVDSDQFMDVRFPGGMDGTQLFGKLAAYAQYVVASRAGWTQWPIEVLSASIVTLSLGLWWLQLHKLRYTKKFILVFIFVAGISEPFVCAADKFRYEPFSFFLISLGLLLTAYRRFFLGMLVAAIALETEPIAVLGLVPVIVLACCLSRHWLKLAARLALALTCAGILYFTLHPKMIHIRAYLSQIRQADTGITERLLLSYFIERTRHLPELLCVLAAFFFYWRRRRTIQSHYLGISALIIGICSLFTPHGNVLYMIFLYPFLIGMALQAYDVEARASLIAGLWLLLLAPQYVALTYLNRNQAYRSSDVQQVTRAIEDASHQLAIPDSELRIYGDYGLWFAHPHFYRAAAETTAAQIGDADLYVCYANAPHSIVARPDSVFYCPDLKLRLPLRLISTTSVRGTTLYLYAKL